MLFFELLYECEYVQKAPLPITRPRFSAWDHYPATPPPPHSPMWEQQLHQNSHASIHNGTYSSFKPVPELRTQLSVVQTGTCNIASHPQTTINAALRITQSTVEL